MLRGGRIRYRKVDEETGNEVAAEDIVKGYQVSKGEYIEFWRYRDDGRRDAHQRGSGAHSIRQRCGDDGQDRTRLVRKARSTDALHCARRPWENGRCESFNGKLRDECLNGEIFYSM